MIVTILFIYLALVLFIGLLSHRLFRGTGEDYFMASRSIGSFVLLMTLFGTHMTAFSILGASGEAYRVGVGVFALMGSSTALVAPAMFYFLGVRLWSLGKKHGYSTQVQFFRDRWESHSFGYYLFAVLVALMIPYLLIGVMGGGQTVEAITSGQIPAWAGGLLICLVIFCYVSYGGLRGTAWVNTFQTALFMILGAVAFRVILSRLGGLESVMARVAETRPDLLVPGENISPWKLFSYTLIPMSVGMFPHMFMHWLSAKSAATFRKPLVLYPFCILVVWVPSVLLGLMGTIDFSGLNGPAANTVVIRMVAEYAPGALGGLLAAGVFAAIMSSLDSQSLALGTMFTRDVVEPLVRAPLNERREVLSGRLFVFAILTITYILSQFAAQSIFKLAVWSFSGFAALLPLVVAALYWKRSNATGAMAALGAVVVLWIYFFLQGNDIPGYSVGGSGIMPVAVMLLASSLAMIAGSLLSQPPDETHLRRFFD